ncbi:hypothetical protein BHYA_0161g00230 [Botrytis hyacinthi]|uniref:Uncharacterized protein n=1 Tax=Botrytis hyacinthi TaxID=278943 RepID=A0A4Z1GJI7_9HELO|nr:hypothetical protein BHYA_0161g00230 [Botrytis hyacinthi]
MAFGDLIIGDEKVHKTIRNIKINIVTDFGARGLFLAGLTSSTILQSLMELIEDGWMVANSQARKDLGDCFPYSKSEDEEVGDMEFEAPELPDSTFMNASFLGRQERSHDSLFAGRRDSVHNRALRMYTKQSDKEEREKKYLSFSYLLLIITPLKVKERRSTVRITRTRVYDLGQYDVPVSDRTHLPVMLQFYVLTDMQLLLKEACFKWLKKYHPGVLASCHCTHELDTEFHLFHRRLNGHEIKENTLRLSANQEPITFLGLLWKVEQIRHSAVHRTPRLAIEILDKMLEDAIQLTEMLNYAKAVVDLRIFREFVSTCAGNIHGGLRIEGGGRSFNVSHTRSTTNKDSSMLTVLDEIFEITVAEMRSVRV